MTLAADNEDPLFWQKVRRARAMTPEARLRAGAELYEYTRAICLAGIRSQHPNATEAEVREFFRQRLRIARQLESVLTPDEAMLAAAATPSNFIPPKPGPSSNVRVSNP